MKKILYFYIFLLSIILVIACSDNNNNINNNNNNSSMSQWQLLQVQMIARHGDRTPCNTFPTDPYKHLWSQGFEQLTELGALQHQELGRFLRMKYRHFLPTKYHKDEIYIRSSDTDRTILSGQNCMRGLYDESTVSHLTNYTTNYQMFQDFFRTKFSLTSPTQVPIHSVPKKYDRLLKMSSPCPLHKRDWQVFVEDSSYFKEIVDKFKELRELLLEQTGLKRLILTGQQTNTKPNEMENKKKKKKKGVSSSSLSSALIRDVKLTWESCDPILIWYRRGLKLPDWVNDTIISQCEEWIHIKHTIRFYPETSRRLRGGPLLKHLLKEFRRRANGKSTHLFLGYFAHDSTLAALMSRLYIHNSRQPPLASALLMELYQSTAQQGRKYVVRFLYRNETQAWTDSLYQLQPMHCRLTTTTTGEEEEENSEDGQEKRFLCDLSELENGFRDKLPLDVDEECGIKCYTETATSTSVYWLWWWGWWTQKFSSISWSHFLTAIFTALFTALFTRFTR